MPICWPTFTDAATPEQIEHGKRLVNEHGCAACHEINGVRQPENFAPELTRIGSKPINQLAFAPGIAHTCRTTSQPRFASPGSFGPA